MKNWTMYSKIQELKRKGFKKNQVKRYLNIDYRTVSKYWDMSASDYAALANDQSRTKLCDPYRNDICEWISEYPDISTAQCFDWLLEKYKTIKPKERTLRAYIKELREDLGMPKAGRPRQYEAVSDPPMGYQAQVDMGQIWLKKSNGRNILVYCFAMVLSHSRYKFVYWTDRPFNTQLFIEVHNKAFDFFGGRTTEIVYDQDKVLAVSENNGDIIYTEGFQQYIETMKFKVYLCRGADPESKGKVENVVKYAKYNFAEHRIYHDIDTLNDQCLSWLERRANGKEHETTKKIPAEVYALEKQHLIPVSTFRNISDTSISYGVRKDNTVLYKSNRYQVPKGTYAPEKRVNLSVQDGIVELSDIETGSVYARHSLSENRGELIKLTHTERDRTNTMSMLYEKALKSLSSSNDAQILLSQIRLEKPRYIREQYSVIIQVCDAFNDQQIIRKATEYCVKNHLWSAGDWKQSVIYFDEICHSKEKVIQLDESRLPEKYQGCSPKIRDINEYVALMERKENYD